MEDVSSAIQQIMASRGYFVSRKRQIIIDQLCMFKYIENIDDFWIRIRQNHTISWATVRNTIRLLIDLECLIPLDKAATQQGFDLRFSVGEK